MALMHRNSEHNAMFFKELTGRPYLAKQQKACNIKAMELFIGLDRCFNTVSGLETEVAQCTSEV